MSIAIAFAAFLAFQPEAPAACQPRQFVLYPTVSDEGALDQESKAAIDEVATYVASASSLRVDVSSRRASARSGVYAVRDRLEERGVSPDVLSASPGNEQAMMMGDGVREPLDRLVTVSVDCS